METYKSRYTAEDLDNTIGLVHGLVVPHVGDNGNWVVGETDTGVFARGIDVTNAVEGQTVVIKEVDENGRPVVWGVKDFPAEGGSTVTIAEMTVAEDVAKVTLPQFTAYEVNLIKSAKLFQINARLISPNGNYTFGVYRPGWYSYMWVPANNIGCPTQTTDLLGIAMNLGSDRWLTVCGRDTPGISRSVNVATQFESFYNEKDCVVLEANSTDGIIRAGSTISVKVVM